MKKLLIVALVLLVFSSGFVFAQNTWEVSAPAGFRININKNQWSPGYQWANSPAWLMSGKQFQAGERYELEMTFTSNRAIPEMNAVLVDNSAAAPGWWGELSEYMTMENIPANTPFTVKLVFDITKSSSGTSGDANKLCFDYQSPNQAATLTFTNFVFRRVR